MWYYLLASQKRGRGWLSNITYAGGSTGYETTEEGVPEASLTPAGFIDFSTEEEIPIGSIIAFWSGPAVANLRYYNSGFCMGGASVRRFHYVR